jgi:hypothetical protein
MRLRLVPTLLILAALSGAVSSCDSGDSDERKGALQETSPSGGGVSADVEEFAKDADALCYSPPPPSGLPPAALEDQARAATQQAQFRTSLADRLSQLSPPTELSEPMQTFAAAQARASDLLSDQAQAAEAGDATEVQSLSAEINLELAKGAASLAGLGFDRCSAPVSSAVASGLEPPAGNLAAQADDVCAGAGSIGADGSAAAVTSQWRDAYADLRQLDPPAGASDQWQQLLDLINDRLGGKQADAALYSQENAIASQLGMKTCGQSGVVGL